MDTLYQIIEVEKIIKIKEGLGKDASFEKELVRSWKQWLKKHPNHIPVATTAKSTGIKASVRGKQ